MYVWMGKGVLKSCCMNPVELSMLNPVQFTITVIAMTQCYCTLLHSTIPNEWQRYASVLYPGSTSYSDQQQCMVRQCPGNMHAY
jgi:hypothetical protein